MRKLTFYVLVTLVMLGTAFDGSAQEKKKTVFNHIALSVYDLHKSAAFYRDVIGLDTIPEPFKIGKHVWFEIAPGFSLHLVNDATEIREHNRSTHTCFSVPSIEEFIARLNARGITYYSAGGERGATNTRPDGVRQLYITDPDGYWVEINDEAR